MIAQVPSIALNFEATFDSSGLFAAVSVYDDASGLVSGPTAMTNVVGATYNGGNFTPTTGHQYLIFKAVYTDGTYATLDSSRLPLSEKILCTSGSTLPFKKNTPLAGFSFPMFNSLGTPLTGLTVSAQRIIDGGTIGNCTNSVAEVSNGFYKIDLSAADLNGNSISFLLTASGAVATTFTAVTQ